MEETSAENNTETNLFLGGLRRYGYPAFFVLLLVLTVANILPVAALDIETAGRRLGQAVGPGSSARPSLASSEKYRGSVTLEETDPLKDE